MALFRKSKPTPVPTFVPSPPIEKKCKHKFQDFPWYIEGITNADGYGREYYTLTIKEPYVCIYCGERKDKVLWEIQHYGSEKDGMKAIHDLREKFKDHIRHKAEIEDMINDMKLVDVEYLKYYHLLAGTSDPSTSRPLPSWDHKPELKL